MLVANPDGYQYTFASPDTRLWRKNLRDNNGERDDRGRRRRRPEPQLPGALELRRRGLLRASRPATRTAASAEASEPETQAITGLYDRIDFAFHVNYHSAGQWLLYPGGLADRDPDGGRPDLLRAVREPGQPGDRGLPSGALVGRPLRHERRDDRLRACAARDARVDARALRRAARLRVRVPGRRGARPGGVRAEPAVRARRRQVGAPTRTTRSRTSGSTTKPFYLKSDDTYKTGLPGANFTFDVSYGDPQEVRVLAKKALRNVNAQVPDQRWQGQSARRQQVQGRRPLRRDRRSTTRS